MKGHLPKAYLRMDPDLDAKHPDNLAEFVRLICAANRQPWRGRFRSRAVVEGIVGKGAAKRAIDRGDLIPATDHECDHCPFGDPSGDDLYLDGWDIWQEGDLTVADRMKRYRNRNAGVTHPSPERIEGSNGGRNAPSKTARQQDSKTSNDDEGGGPDELQLLADDLLAPSRATPRQFRAIAGFARSLGTAHVLEVLRHWRGQVEVNDKFSAAFDQLKAEAESARKPGKKSSEWDYLDEGGAAA